MVITQKEKKPLLDYISGAKLDGVRCGMYYARTTKTYYATVHGLENIVNELNMILPFIRTRKKLRQVQKFRQFLAEKRTRHQHQARQALELLDSGPLNRRQEKQSAY